MNKMYTLVSAFMLTTAGSALAQGNELFISEYDEGAHPSATSPNPCANTPGGTGNEKALEIFNPTTATVNLDVYSIRRYSNGSLTETEDERMKRTTGVNTMAPNSTFVIAHPEATLADIVSVKNQTASIRASGPNATVLVGGGPIQFNGDDAMVLVRWTGAVAGQGTPVIVDIFGIIGHQPTMPSQWSGVDANGVFVASANQSLVRRPAISSGSLTWNRNTNPGLDPATYNIADEWEAYGFAFPAGLPADQCGQAYNDLGQHTYTGPNGTYNTSVGLLEEFNNAIQFYPNPASGRVNVALGTAKVGRLTVLNGLGRSVSVQPMKGAETTSLDVTGLAPGLYFVRCESADGKLTIYKELVVQ